MIAVRDLALARQRNYQMIIDTTFAWTAEKAVTPWGRMYRVVTAAVAKAGGVVFADDLNPDQEVAAAAVRSFLDRVPVTGTIIGDIQTVDPGAITAEQEARARDIIDHWDQAFFVADLAAETGPKGDKGDTGPAGPQGPPGVGGARTSRGTVWAEELSGATLNDKIRQAWGSGDRRVIRAQHNDILNVGASPIPIRAGCALMVGDTPQTEFSDNGRLYVRGSSAVFENVADGTNFGETKGWSLYNIGFEGESHLSLFKPQRGTGPKMVYPIIRGCSVDTFKTILDATVLGPKFDILYTNNIYGPFAYRWGGSDGTFFPGGGKLDWGQSNSVGGRQALIVCDYLEKSFFGPLYATGEGSACLEILGNTGRIGLNFAGATFEGRNATEVSLGAVIRQKSGVTNFSQCQINYANGNGADKGYADVRTGYASFSQCGFLRGNPGPSQSSALISRGSGAVVDVTACREFPSMKAVTAVVN